MRIVAIDDNPDDRLLAARVLKEAFPHATVVQASDPGSVERAIAQGADLVITDYALRWTTGIDIADQMAKRLPGVPVILFTNTGSEEIAARALRHGLADYVIKRGGEFGRLANAAKNALTHKDLRARIDVLLAQERAARLDAERASRLREDFLATLSHELRTPLHAMMGWINLLQMGELKTDAERADAYEVIARNVRVQSRLIDDLLDLSRIASGKLTLDLAVVPLAPILREGLQEIEPLARERSVTLAPLADAYDGAVLVDAARLRQVIRNLLENAIKFSFAGGRVELAAASSDGRALVSVTDQGAGIPAQFLPHIFERFRQADSSTTRRAGGMGIGLSVAKELVEAHDGTIDVHSEGEGRGATFRISLPIPAGRAATPAVPPSGALPSLAGRTILVVDDEPDALSLLRRALEGQGAHVVTAASASEALAYLENARPDLIVSDIGMPEQDGYAFMRAVRAGGAPAAQTPAIALTAFVRPEDRQRALLAGFQGHLGKPVSAADLVRAVAAALQN